MQINISSVLYEQLMKWCAGRDTEPGEVIEELLDRFLDELDPEYPKVTDRDNINDIKTDIRYERQCDARRGL